MCAISLSVFVMHAVGLITILYAYLSKLTGKRGCWLSQGVAL